MAPQPLPPEAYDTKNIFRVQNIPHDVSLAMFPSFFSPSCVLMPDEIHVHSFSRVDAASQESPITATLTFSRKPGFWDANVCPQARRMRRSILLDMLFDHDQGPLEVDQQLLGFTPLTPLAIQQTPDRKSIDCIVLHGFGAHALGAFQGRGSPDIWIRDWLPNDFPKLDVFTYGYGTQFNDPSSTGDIHEWAEALRSDLRAYRSRTKGNARFKPILFIAHSLGGLVFKHAIVSMANSANFPEDENIVKCIHDVFFFAVPSQGMDTEDMEVMAKGLPARIMVALLNEKYLHRMRQTLNTQFDQAFPYKDSMVYQFYEALPTKGVTMSGQERMLVPQISTIGRHWENGNDYKMQIEGDHRTLVKFSRADASQYQRVKGVLEARMKTNPWETVRRRFSWGLRDVPPEEKRRQMLEWLATVDPSDIHRRSLDLREDHTCQWVFRWAEWDCWSSPNITSDTKRLLWIWGIPGAGKTILASSVISNLESLQSSDPLCGVAYYYCTHARATGNDVESFLGWIISRLGYQASLFVPAVVERSYSRGVRPTTKEMLESLRETCQGFNRVFIIVDGLDESHSRPEFLRCLKRITSTGGLENLRLLVTSRDEQDIRDALQPVATMTSMSNRVVDEDIGKFIRSKLSEDSVFARWPAPLLQRVEQKLRSGAKGMFRWAACQLEILSTQYHDTEIDILQALDSLPETLDKTYEAVLAKVPPQHQKKVQVALCRIVAHRQCSPESAEDADCFLEVILLDTTSNCKHPNNRLFTLDNLKAICSCLITINEGGVRFSHYTVKEFLFSSRILDGPAKAFHTTENRALATSFKADLAAISTLKSPPDPAETGISYPSQLVESLVYTSCEYDAIPPHSETEAVDSLLVKICSAESTTPAYLEEHFYMFGRGAEFLAVRGSVACGPAETCARMMVLGAPEAAVRYLQALPPDELAAVISTKLQLDVFPNCSLLDVAVRCIEPECIVQSKLVKRLTDLGIQPSDKILCFLPRRNSIREDELIEVLSSLLRLRVTPNPDNVPWTPLQASIWDGNLELAWHLLDAGANPEAAGRPVAGTRYSAWSFDTNYSGLCPIELEKKMRKDKDYSIRSSNLWFYKWIYREPGRRDLFIKRGFELLDDVPDEPYM